MQLKCSWRIWWYRSDTAMKDCPQPAKRPELFGTKSIQNVMKNNYHETKTSDHLCRQKHQTSQNNHRHTDHPDHQQNRYVIIDVEKQAEPENRQFKKNKPKPARQQKPRQFLFWLAPSARQKRSSPGEKNKNRSAEMCDPSGKEIGGCCSR